ncbi:MAG: amino acid adenylation domain-containing protein, partial [Exilibacterium sp.]
SQFPPLLDLPYDNHWSADAPPLGAWEPISLDEELVNKLNTIGKLHGASTNITLLAAFEVLLNRYTNQSDIIVGSPRANRIFQEIKNITGHFTNTVILRNNLSGRKPFTQILKEVRVTSTEASYQYNLPYLILNEIARDMGKPADQPLYQVGIEYRPFLFESFRIGDCEIEDIVFHGMGDAKFELLFSFTQTGNGLSGHIEYNTEIFKRSTVLQIFSHFKVLLQSIVNTPDTPISSLDILPNAEKQKILVDWNKTEIEYPTISCVHQLYEERVALTPDAIAVVCEDQYLSYSHLNLWSNQLAHYLIEQGVKPDMCVGLSVERSFEMTIGILGILKAGSAYVPLDPDYPTDRLAYMVEQADVDILLTQEKLYFHLPVHPRVLALDHRADWTAKDIKTVQNPLLSATSQHLAYVIFTSGSTGRPKAVAMPHTVLVNLIQWQVKQSTSSVGTRTLQFSAFSFDVSFQELFSTWASGGVLVLTSEELRKDPFSLWYLIRNQYIHRLFIPFIELQQLAEVYPDITCNNKISNQSASSNTLQEVITAGEQLQITAPIRAMFRHLSHCRLYNHYGPSETHVCTALKLEGPAKEWEAIPSIGTPIANNKVYVLDEFLQAVPVGVFGELYVGGVGVARGYLNRETETAERFIQNPYINQEIPQNLNNRLYKTGDIVRFRTDGTLEYRGRTDNQVKIRGFRIELGEIEQLLTEQAGIKAAVVSVFRRSTRTDDQYIAAYVTAEEHLSGVNKQRRQEHLRDILQKTLPEYMVPSIFVFLDSLPLTPTGKVDRRALPVPHKDTLFKKTYKAPETLIEKNLVEIWANILSLPVARVGVKDNFFALGGHSLLATRVVSQVRNKFNIELPIRELFTASTIKELAVRIERLVSHIGLPDQEAFPLRKANVREKNLLSFAQQRLLFLSQFETGRNIQYNIPWALRLEGSLSVAALEWALNELLQRHESLRTVFQSEGGEVYQKILHRDRFNLPVVDVPADDLSTELSANVNEVFDLNQGPIFYFKLLRLTPQLHVLLLNMHHIVADGWSIGVFNRELAAFYTAYKQSKPCPLIPLPIQYADFAYWQRQWLQGGVLDKQMEYWKNHLRGAPVLLELPTDRPRPATQSFRGSTIDFVIPMALTGQLQQLSQQQGATLFMTLLTGFYLLLARYSGQDDICVGTPIANRRRAELENLIGFFVNTLVLRSRIDANTTVKNVLEKVKETALSAYAHQDIPFEQLVEALKPERSLSYSPLFQVMFVLQNNADQAVSLPGIKVSTVESPYQTAKFDLTLSLVEKEKGLGGVVEYNTDLFDETTIERFVRHYRNLLASMTRYPDRSVEQLPLLSEIERQQILFDWNRTEVDYQRDLCIHQLFERQVEKTPHSVAVEFEDQKLTYQELNRKSNQLAHHLTELGVGPELRVGICIERSLEMIIGLLGILKAGGAYVPIDIEYPQQRIDYLINDSSIALVLMRTKIGEEKFSRHQIRSLCLDTDWHFIDIMPSVNPNAKVSLKSLIYVIYTSGSTGKPKGVMINHGSYLNHMHWMQRVFDIKSKEKVLQKTSLSFDAAGWEWSLPLISGATLVVAKAEGHRDPDYLLEVIDHHQVTVFQGTPSLVNLLVDHKQSSKLHSLRYLFCGGEPLSVQLCERFKAKAISSTLCNLYGPTETTIDSTYWTLDSNEILTSVPIGRPIDNVKIHLLDLNLNPVPVGVVGEICIGGAGVARGYLNCDDLTHVKFIQDPFSSHSEDLLYRSGDLARYLPDGNIEYIGRMDYQVKVRGFRIELGEIESVLNLQPSIREVCVVVYESQQKDKYLVAYLVCRNNGDLNKKALKDTLGLKLPDYMIPNIFIILDQLPLTHNGKVDRKALPVPNESSLLTNAYIAPRSETEKMLTGIWAETLSLPAQKVGVDSSFFDLGGHSLLATRVISQIRKTYDIELSIRELFTSVTIRELAIKVEEYLNHSPLTDAQTFPLLPLNNRECFPLSFAQQRLWFLNQFEPQQNIQYNIPWALRLEGSLSVAALEWALNELLKRHESLRTIFQSEGGEVYQKITHRDNLNIPIVDVQTDNLAAELSANVNEVFDLNQGPVFRVRLLQLSSQVHVLLLNVHHIAADGWSIGIFNRELAALYTAYEQDKPSPLRSLPIQYADFAHWQRQWLQGEVLDKQMEYWKNHLQGAPALLTLPTDRPRPATQSFRGSTIGFVIPMALTGQLQQLSQQQGTTLFMTLLAGFYLLLARYSGQDDVCVGTPIANRRRAELENLIGFFVNTLVLRASIDGEDIVKNFIHQVKETALLAYANQDIPFEQLVEALNPDRNLSHSPLFQVMFVLQNVGNEKSIDFPNTTASILESEFHTSKFDLILGITESFSGLEGKLEYNTDLFDQVTMERLVRHYENVLESMVWRVDQPLLQLNLLSEIERKQLLVDWNNTKVEYPKDQCIHQLFEMQVKKTPDVVAVVINNQQITYEFLNNSS